MRSDGGSPNFVFIDLSKLDASAAAAFLADRAQRSGPDALAPDQRCHWILGPHRGPELLAASGPGPEFLRRRLSLGDRLFLTNPTGFDWNHLFPFEAENELKALQTLSPWAPRLFLETTPEAPTWLDSSQVFRASPEGLVVHSGAHSLLVPWATKDRAPHRGAWWIIPGQALLTGLPPLPWALLDQVPSSQTSPSPRAPTPAQKQDFLEVAKLRRSPTSLPLHQNTLFRSSEFPGLGTKEAVDFEEALGGIRKRSLVANMQGQSDLKEQGLLVRFVGGRLVKIEDTVTQTTLCTGAESYLEWNGQRHHFQVNSAFSFEGDFSWGLRQSLVLAHDDLAEPGRAIVDYYFVEESREFFVAATVRWPRWKAPCTIGRWGILELSLFDLPGAPLSTRVLWPDGRSSDRIHRGRAEGVLSGTDFVFSSGNKSLVLGFPQNQEPRPHLLPWSIHKHWGRSSLVVSPEGGAGPRLSGDFDGYEEHFSFYLTPAEGAKLPFTVTRKQAIELIPPAVTRP